ncbi:ABC transporter permease [[Clostridium] scindens]|uniref:ABC transporter permease n=1 Tax=Clostridium scindens (strain JCM 10418 / VPI 12708) TaxID=29347 RepID=UPI00156E9F5C|nr:ABC transporter permease [[Clostridium] scindens]NSI88766.1 ABC transporter permease [[Clostridium] scindens]NSJ03544.1 ABC transporter permease [[Clostridium] scindens]
MFFKLFMKECSQTAKSLTYWLLVIIMVLFFASQMGQMDMEKAPEKGLEDYGVKPSKDKNIIMSATLGMLAGEYAEGRYTTYPIGFVKSVTLGKEEEAKVGEILKEATGLDKEEIEEKIDEFYENSGGIITSRPVLEPLESLSYGRFEEIMQEVDDMLGGGSSYALDSLGDNGSEPKTYEDAVKEYEELVQKDGYTGGYARLFSDYMVIILGILPVFLAVTRELRDRRANMQELIYVRRSSSMTIIASRYLSMVVMILIPVFALSIQPLASCITYAKTAGISVDYLAFAKYIAGWLLPTVMVVTALGMLLTELTDTALAVLVQGAWWFVSIFMGAKTMDGGRYGWNLIPRHNTILNYSGYQEGFSQLLSNRILYASLAVIAVSVTAWIYSQKRKGRMNIRGKISANRKSQSNA